MNIFALPSKFGDCSTKSVFEKSGTNKCFVTLPIPAPQSNKLVLI